MKGIEVLPCGCLMRSEIRNGQRHGTYVPCRKTCEMYQAMLDYAAETNKPLTFTEAP